MSTEARWPIRDGDRVGRGQESEGLTAETVRKRPERLWTAPRTMEVLRRCPLAIAQRLVHCAIAVSTAVLDRVTKTIFVALLLMNNLDNSKQKMSNLLSPAPPPYSWSLLGKFEGQAPPPSSDLAWNPWMLQDDMSVCYTGHRQTATRERVLQDDMSVCYIGHRQTATRVWVLQDDMPVYYIGHRQAATRESITGWHVRVLHRSQANSYQSMGVTVWHVRVLHRSQANSYQSMGVTRWHVCVLYRSQANSYQSMGVTRWQVCMLQITGKQLPEWGFHQLEVTADRHINQRDTVWNVEEHRYTKSESYIFTKSMNRTF